MAHTHGDPHSYREVDVIDRGSGVSAGIMLAIAALLLIVVIGLAVAWSRPWNSGGTNNNNPNVPGISDNSGGGNGGSGGTNNGGGGGGQAAP
jgi:hypothetical protein